MPKISYKKLTREHLPYRMKWLNDPEVNRYLGQMTRQGRDEEMHRKWLDIYEDDKTKEIFMTECNGQMIGQVGLVDIHLIDQNACLYIVIGEKDYWNKGVGSEAMEFILDYGFSKLKLHKICLDVHARNENAIKLYKKFGFEQEGVFKDQVHYADSFGDEIRMAKFNPKKSC